MTLRNRTTPAASFLRSCAPWLPVLLAGAMLWAAGCSQSDPASGTNGGTTTVSSGTGTPGPGTGTNPTPPTNPAGGPAVTADQALKRMTDAYRAAKSYSDQGRVEFRMEMEPADPPQPNDPNAGKPQVVSEDADFTVAFVRPNKLRMWSYQGAMVTDGTQLRAMTRLSPQEMLAVDAPPSLTIDNIYFDDVLTHALTQGIAGSPLQVLLLLENAPLSQIFQGSDKIELVEPAEHDGRRCDRVQAARPDGLLVLWIDQQDFVLRRVDLPVFELADNFRKQGAKLKHLSVTANFASAQLNGPVDDSAFRLEPSANAKLVKEFDRKAIFPPPPAPSALLGKPLPNFEVALLDGQKVNPEALAGHVTVLDFWFTTCPPCRQSLPLLEKVYQQYKTNAKVRFLAVSVDGADIADAALSETFAQLGVTVPIVRDPESKLSGALEVRGYPTMVLVGANGKVQHVEMGFNPQLATLLPERLEKLLAGEDLFAQEIRDYEQRLAQYEQSLRGAEIPRANVAPSTMPQSLKLEKLWSCTELERPGNLLVVQTPGQPPQILVNDGFQGVAELGLDGKIVARHQLKLGEKDVVACLRTAVDAKGQRYFVALASSQPQLFVFDAQWNQLFSYPADRDHAGVADAQLADLDGDGSPELCVSYWGVVGVQAVSLQGERLWGNRSLENAFRLAVTGPDDQGHRRLLCAHGKGTLVPIDYQGHDQMPLAAGELFLRYIASADLNGDGVMELAGVSASTTREEAAVGLSPTCEVIWTVPMPNGVQQLPIEMISHGPVLGNQESQWLLAGPDGSIHILAADGKLVDRFHYGAALGGLAAVEINGSPVLLVSTEQGIDALRVTPPTP